MKIAVLGTGVVGRAHAAKLAALGHDVIIGTNDVDKKLSAVESGNTGRPSFANWLSDHKKVKVASFAESANPAEIVIVALNGKAAVEVLSGLKPKIKGKIIIDITNPLDFSKGFPPTLTVCNTYSLGEQIQETLPESFVVKTLNTINSELQVNPGGLGTKDHHNFMAGNDEAAKKKVAVYLSQWYGWEKTIDLGSIKAARGMEMILPLWINLASILDSFEFNFKIVEPRREN